MNSQIRGVATDFFPKGGNEGRAETKRKHDTSRAFLPRAGESGTEVLGVGWHPVAGSGAYFGFLVSGHAEESEENTSMEALLHVNNLRGWGHPLIELSGDIAQIGVQALLQGFIEDNLCQTTDQSEDLSLRHKGLWVGCAGAHGLPALA